jgi:hypothetical protein
MMVFWQRCAAELAGGQSGCNLGITSHALRRELGSSAVFGSISEIDLLDPFSQLFVRVAGILEKGPHPVNHEDQPIETIVEIEEILDTRT